jgi:hypothetical protein
MAFKYFALPLLLCMAFQPQPRIFTQFVNPSFEDPHPRESASPVGWSSQTQGSTSDILPGAWGLPCKPYSGKTCLGLVTRDDGSSEDIGQMLAKPLTPNDCFTFSIYLAHAEKYVGYNQPIRLRIWGGSYPGQKQVLLDASPLITHSDWKQYTFYFTPKQGVSCLTFEAYFAPGASFKYKGNILLDLCSVIEQCDKA